MNLLSRLTFCILTISLFIPTYVDAQETIYFSDTGMTTIEDLNDSNVVSDIEEEFVEDEVVIPKPGLFSQEPVISEIVLDKNTVQKGYTVESDDRNFRIGFTPGVLEESTPIRIKHFNKDLFDFPEDMIAVSDVYEFDIVEKNSYVAKEKFVIELRAYEEVKDRKRIFFYNGVESQWQELPSWTQDEELVRAYIHLPFARFVILEEDGVMEIGDASWYAYKNCDCAASPDYPKGSQVKVTDLDTQESIIVTINDWGPDRAVHPERVIDLDKVAFERLGKLSWGVIHRIKVEPIQ